MKLPNRIIHFLLFQVIFFLGMTDGIVFKLFLQLGCLLKSLLLKKLIIMIIIWLEEIVEQVIHMEGKVPKPEGIILNRKWVSQPVLLLPSFRNAR